MRRSILVVVAAAAVVLVAVTVIVIRGRESKGVPPSEVPSSIASDCSRAVDAEINAFLQTVPDGRTILFGENRCYGLDRSVVVRDRSDLVLDGRGSTFKLLSQREDEPCQANWRVLAGSNITVKNMIAVGLHKPGGYDGPRITTVAAQCQHGFTFDSVQGGTLLDSKALDVLGDPVSVEPDNRQGGDYCAVPPNRNIVIDRFHGFNAGRTVGITHADGVLIQNSYFGDMWDNAIDLETDVACESSRNVRILNNRFGRAHYSLVAYTGSEPPERSGAFEFSGNIAEEVPSSCIAPVFIRPLYVFPDPEVRWRSMYGADNPRQSFTIRNNTLKTLGDGVLIYNAGQVVIEGNKISRDYGSGCVNSTLPWAPDNYGAVLVDVQGANVHGNSLINGPNGGLKDELWASPTSVMVARSPQGTPAPPSP